MEISETFFSINSYYTLKFLDMLDVNNEREYRWTYMLIWIDSLLKKFKYSLIERYNFTLLMRNVFVKEHGSSKELKVTLDMKYREKKKLINLIFSEENLDNELILVRKAVEDQLNKLDGIIPIIINNTKGQDKSLTDVLASYIHMAINRLFISRQRTYEMVLFDLLTHHYKSEIARSKEEVEI